MSLELLKNRIHSLRNKIYWLIAVCGFSKLFLIVFLLCMATFVLDYFLRFPMPVRFLFFLAFWGCTIYYSFRNLWSPLNVKISDDDVALALEKANPFLQDKLISALQFLKLLESPDYKESKSLSLKVIQDAQQTVSRIRFTGILDIKRGIIAVFLPIFITIAALFCLSSFPRLPGLANIWFKRNFFLQEIPWPRRTYLFLMHEKSFVVSGNKNVTVAIDSAPSVSDLTLWYKEEQGGLLWRQRPISFQNGKSFADLGVVKKNLLFYLQSGADFSDIYKIIRGEESAVKEGNEISLRFPDYKIVKAKGESLFLKVAAIGESPRTVRIGYSFKSGKLYKSPMATQGDGVYQYDFQTLTEDISFYFEGNDDNDGIPVYQVQILSPPTTESVVVWYRYPPYTKLQSTPWETPQAGGNITGLAGTEVTLGVKTNIPVSLARIVFIGKQEAVLPPLNLSLTPLSPELQKWPGYLFVKFPISYDIRYKIDLIAENGLPDPNPASFYIRALKDQPPNVQVMLPKKKHIYMTCKGNLSTKFKTTDDFGIAKITIQTQLNRQEWEETVFDRNQNDKDYGEKEISSQYMLEFAKMKAKKVVAQGLPPENRELQKGDTIGIKLCVQDNNTASGVGVKESPPIIVDILDASDLGEILSKRLKEVKSQLRKILDQQSKLQQDIQILAGISGDLEAGDIASILQHCFTQRSISRDVSVQGDEVADILQTMVDNSIWDVYTRQNIETVYNLLVGVSIEEQSGQYKGISGDTVKSLTDAYQIVRKEQKKGKDSLQEGLNLQSQIVRDLEKAVALLNQWEDFNEVVRDVEQILELQKKIGPKIQGLIERK